MLEYTKPTVRIISFLAKEPLATNEDADTKEFPLDGTFKPGVESAVEPWT